RYLTIHSAQWTIPMPPLRIRRVNPLAGGTDRTWQVLDFRIGDPLHQGCVESVTVYDQVWSIMEIGHVHRQGLGELECVVHRCDNGVCGGELGFPLAPG